MNCEGRPAFRTQILGDFIRYSFCCDEDEHFGIFGTYGLKMSIQLVPFLGRVTNFDDLSDVMVCGEFHGSYIYLDRVFEEVLR